MSAPRVAFVTCAPRPAITDDDALAAEALREGGAEVTPAVWSDADVDWGAFDAIIVRSTWDYHLRSVEFLAWLGRLEAARAPLWNDARTITWNLDKRYLDVLAERGVLTAPTRRVARGSGVTLATVLREQGWPEVVVKPAVSASAWRTFRASAGADRNAGNAGNARSAGNDGNDGNGTNARNDGNSGNDATNGAAAAEFERLLAEVDVLVQPFLEEVQREGEWSFVFFGGAYSHAMRKRPARGDFRTQEEHGATHARGQPDAALIDRAREALEAVGAPTLYARVDGVPSAGRLCVMEVELIEPSLFFAGDRAAAERFARATRSALR